MAELSKYPIPEERFIRCFSREYNALHGTRFPDDPERAGKVEEGWDYRWPNPDDPKNPLEVQHTVGASDQPSERIHPKNARSIGAAVEQHMKRAGYTGYHVSRRGDDSPRSGKFRDQLIAQICLEIDDRIARGILAGRTVRFGGSWKYGKQSSRYEVELDLVPDLTGVFMTGTIGIFFENAAWRLTEAVRKKSKHVGHARTRIILAVDFDLNGYDLEDLENLREALKGIVIPFREVWVADLAEDTKIHRVWP